MTCEGGGRVMALQLKEPNNAKFLQKKGLKAQWENIQTRRKFYNYKTDHRIIVVLFSDETNQPKRKKQRAWDTSSSPEPMHNNGYLTDEQASADFFPTGAESSQQPLPP